MKKTAMMLAAATALAMPALAHAQDDCADADSQAAMNACFNASLERSDKQLNKLYKQLEARLSDDAQTKKLLVQAQREWVKYRDAECSFQTAGAAGGSVVPALVAMCMDNLTQSRVADFEDYLNCEEGDLSCPVPPAE